MSLKGSIVGAARRVLAFSNRPAVAAAQLMQQIATPSVMSRRVITSMHPSVGLDPMRLGFLLRSAETNDPTAYLELAEDMEEKDLHYLGVLGTRKRAVAQLEVTVEAASESARDIEIADFVRTFLSRHELEDELFHMLDAVGKGYSVVEIVWDISEKQYMPARLEWCEPKWFRFDESGRTLRMIDGAGFQPLQPYKFVTTQIAAKSGLPIRGGLARAVAWAWLFKNFALKDWVIFAEAYGQPVRVGKYGPGASAEDKATLMEAVMNIASDFAAIIPQSMVIELIQADAPKATELYRGLCDYLDQQISKVVVGQTATTDAIKGGYAVGKVHNDVRGDIERSDAKQVAAALNKDLARPIVDLNFGPQKGYPVIRIGNKEAVDVEMMKALPPFIDRGMKIAGSVLRDKFGIPDPDENEEDLLHPAKGSQGGAADEPAAEEPKSSKRAVASSLPAPAPGRDSVERIGAQLEADVAAANDALIDRMKELVNDPSIATLEDLQSRLIDVYPGMNPREIAEQMGSAFILANLVGRDEVDDVVATPNG